MQRLKDTVDNDYCEQSSRELPVDRLVLGVTPGDADADASSNHRKNGILCADRTDVIAAV